jgi:hypothetical protein
MDYAIEEFPEIDILGQTEKKIGWWKNHPRTINRTPRDQLRQWFRKEHEFQSKRRSSSSRGNRVDPYVGSQRPGPTDEEKALIPQWKNEHESYLNNYMKQNGIENEDDVDFTRREVETWTAFLSRKSKEYRAKKD